MAILEEHCVLDVLSDKILSECYPFTCGDEDMDEFLEKMLFHIPNTEWGSLIVLE